MNGWEEGCLELGLDGMMELGRVGLDKEATCVFWVLTLETVCINKTYKIIFRS